MGRGCRRRDAPRRVTGAAGAAGTETSDEDGWDGMGEPGGSGSGRLDSESRVDHLVQQRCTSRHGVWPVEVEVGVIDAMR